jgi:hypothetical protein
MISIVVCSINEQYLRALNENISNTIGEEFELIAINNAGKARGICEVYNLGASQAKYSLLCFLHEDIFIHTNGWGTKLVNIFEKNPQLGLVGVAGTKYQPLIPSGWGNSGLPGLSLTSYNFVQRHKFVNKRTEHHQSNDFKKLLVQVATLDGLFLCARKQAYESYNFDQQRLKGFHGYDIDFSIGINQSYQVAVTHEILIEHFSEGHFGREWFVDTLKVHAKWNKKLPLNISNLSIDACRRVERRTMKEFFKQADRFNLSSVEILKVFNRILTQKTINTFLLGKFVGYFIKSKAGLLT